MSWWAWILFWIVFWVCALAYLARRTWKLWPHLKAFTQAVQQAWGNLERARHTAESAGKFPERRKSREVAPVSDLDSLAWNRPAAAWRKEWRSSRRRRRELRWDEHAKAWATWGRRVD